MLRNRREGALPLNLWLVEALDQELFNQHGFQNGVEVVAIFRTAFDFITPYLQRLEHLYARPANKELQSLLIKLMVFTALGHRKVKLAFNTPEIRHGAVRHEAVCSTSD